MSADEVVERHERCARGQHEYRPNWHQGLCRCTCGAAHPDDLAAALGDNPYGKPEAVPR